MDLSDLFPEQLIAHHIKPFELRFNARQVLTILVHEITIIGICASDVRAGKVLSEADHERLGLAISRVNQAADMVDGKA